MNAQASEEKVLGASLAGIYLALLDHPDDKWRTEHQWIYATLRDAIAERAGLSPENVQTSFEAAARRGAP